SLAPDATRRPRPLAAPASHLRRRRGRRRSLVTERCARVRSASNVRPMAGPVVGCPACGTKNRVPVAAKGHPRCPKCHTDLPWLVDAGDTDFGAAIDTDQLVVVDL